VTAHSDSKGHSAEKYILQRARELDRPFCFKDFCPPISHGYFRNCITRLRTEILPLPHTCPRFYILKERQNMYTTAYNVTRDPIGVRVSQRHLGSLGPRRAWTSFSAFLESLPPTDLAHIHDIHLYFSARNFDFVNKNWEWEDRSKFWHRRFDCPDGWTYTVTAYQGTRTVTVAVGCRFFYSTSGLLRLACLLGGIKGLLGNVPDPMSWTVSLWHYGKDIPCTVRGRDFEVCFETFSGCLGRIYHKHNMGVVRVEEIQSPAKPLAQLFDEILCKDSLTEETE
jgi:hypothetical protein